MAVIVIRSLLLALGVIMLMIAAVQDLRSRIVPNQLVISIAASGLLLGAVTRPLSLWINIVAVLLLVMSFGAVSSLESLGGGDIKLAAAATLLVAPSGIPGLLVAIALAGGVLSLVYLVLRFLIGRRQQRGGARRRRGAISRWWNEERVRIAESRTVPYAVAISCGSASYIIAEWYRCLSATSCSL